MAHGGGDGRGAPPVDAEAEERARRLFESARRNGAGSAPRKHHLVPAFYLRNWAVGGRVRVTVIDEGRSYEAAPERVARETDFYSLEDADLDPEVLPPTFAETLLSEIERAGADAMRSLLTGGVDPDGGVVLSSEHRGDLALFLALQMMRGRSHRDEMRSLFASGHRLLYSLYSDAHIRRHLEDQGVEVTDEVLAENRGFIDDLVAGDVVVGQRRAQEVSWAVEQALKQVPLFAERRWSVVRTPPVLLTCDEPVIRLGGPGTGRGQRSGTLTSGVILFPLSPSMLLVMAHPGLAINVGASLDHVETAEINREIVASGHVWAFDRPGRRTAEVLKVPAFVPMPFMPEQVGGGSDGVGIGALVRWFKPTRWANDADAPPWPVQRWWAGGWRDPWALEPFVPNQAGSVGVQLPNISASPEEQQSRRVRERGDRGSTERRHKPRGGRNGRRRT